MKPLLSIFSVFVLLTILNMPAFACSSSQQQCCKNGKLSCCPKLGGGQSYDLSGCSNLADPIDNNLQYEGGIDNMASECSVGDVKYKYTSDVGGCDYSIETRTCCRDGKWSGWDDDCEGCGNNTCWNGTSCESKINKCAEGGATQSSVSCSEPNGFVYSCTCNGESWGSYGKNDSVPHCVTCTDKEVYGLASTTGVAIFDASCSDETWDRYFGYNAGSYITVQEACEIVAQNALDTYIANNYPDCAETDDCGIRANARATLSSRTEEPAYFYPTGDSTLCHIYRNRATYCWNGENTSDDCRRAYAAFHNGNLVYCFFTSKVRTCE